MNMANHNTVRDFLKEATLASHTGAIKGSDLFQKWIEYCRHNELYAYSPIWLGRKLNFLNIGKAHRNGSVHYLGIEFRSETASH